MRSKMYRAAPLFGGPDSAQGYTLGRPKFHLVVNTEKRPDRFNFEKYTWSSKSTLGRQK